MDPQKIVDYLSRGGLVDMLTHGMGNVPHARAWLNLDLQGNIIHTFSAVVGGIGGSNIPTQTLSEGKILESRSHTVIGFLQTFGLDQSQAEQITFAVGIEGRSPGKPYSLKPRKLRDDSS